MVSARWAAAAALVAAAATASGPLGERRALAVGGDAPPDKPGWSCSIGSNGGSKRHAIQGVMVSSNQLLTTKAAYDLVLFFLSQSSIHVACPDGRAGMTVSKIELDSSSTFYVMTVVSSAAGAFASVPAVGTSWPVSASISFALQAGSGSSTNVFLQSNYLSQLYSRSVSLLPCSAGSPVLDQCYLLVRGQPGSVGQHLLRRQRVSGVCGRHSVRPPFRHAPGLWQRLLQGRVRAAEQRARVSGKQTLHFRHLANALAGHHPCRRPDRRPDDRRS
jgi:hypothetical protein